VDHVILSAASLRQQASALRMTIHRVLVACDRPDDLCSLVGAGITQGKPRYGDPPQLAGRRGHYASSSNRYY
jgi:hypothetical protein